MSHEGQPARLNDLAARRQAWLDGAQWHLAQHFTTKGLTLPATTRVSWGFPSKRATSAKRRTVGECFPPGASKDEAAEIFLHPILANHEPDANHPTREVLILATLAHEDVHAAVGNDCGHKGAFRSAALKIGLEGKMTATHAGQQFRDETAGILAALGPFPTAGIDPTTGQKKQGTRLIKCVCPACGYTLRTTAKWLSEAGSPICPVDHLPIEPESLGPPDEIRDLDDGEDFDAE